MLSRVETHSNPEGDDGGKRDQARRSRTTHYGADGSKPKDRAARAGYRPKIAAENIASG
jgi:uncharacterized protein YkwD